MVGVRHFCTPVQVWNFCTAVQPPVDFVPQASKPSQHCDTSEGTVSQMADSPSARSGGWSLILPSRSRPRDRDRADLLKQRCIVGVNPASDCLAVPYLDHITAAPGNALVCGRNSCVVPLVGTRQAG